MSTGDVPVKVYTGSVKNGGTDSKIHLTLHGLEKSGRRVLLNALSDQRNAFVAGATDTCVIPGSGKERLGRIYRITLESDGSGRHAGWYLSKIVVKDTPRKGDARTFTIDEWIPPAGGLTPFTKDYYWDGRIDVWVYTDGEHPNAGTDSKVYLTMHGLERSSSPVLLNRRSDQPNAFVAGATDHCVIAGRGQEGLGRVFKIGVESDRGGRHAGWYLSKIVIRDGDDRDDRRTFTVNQWVGTTKENARIEPYWDDWRPELVEHQNVEYESVVRARSFNLLHSQEGFDEERTLEVVECSRVQVDTSRETGKKVGAEAKYESPEMAFGKFSVTAKTEFEEKLKTGDTTEGKSTRSFAVRTRMKIPPRLLTIVRYRYRVPYRHGSFGAGVLGDEGAGFSVRTLAMTGDVLAPESVDMWTLKAGEIDLVPSDVLALLPEDQKREAERELAPAHV